MLVSIILHNSSLLCMLMSNDFWQFMMRVVFKKKPLTSPNRQKAKNDTIYASNYLESAQQNQIGSFINGIICVLDCRHNH